MKWFASVWAQMTTLERVVTASCLVILAVLGIAVATEDTEEDQVRASILGGTTPQGCDHAEPGMPCELTDVSLDENGTIVLQTSLPRDLRSVAPMTMLSIYAMCDTAHLYPVQIYDETGETGFDMDPSELEGDECLEQSQ